MTWRLSMNRPGHRIGACFGKAALKTHALQTLRDRRASPNRAKRLECVRFIGAFRPARDGPRFMVPMHAKHRTSNIEQGAMQCRIGSRRLGVPCFLLVLVVVLVLEAKPSDRGRGRARRGGGKDGSWRAPFRFFECIGTMNLSGGNATCLESRLQAVRTG